MKKLLFLFLFCSLTTQAQVEHVLKLKLAVLQNFISKGAEGETLFWQTKGKITFGIVNYTEEQNPKFRDLFIAQYRELEPVYMKMLSSGDDKDTTLFVTLLIRQEEDYRNMLTPEQREKYLKQMAVFEATNPQMNDSYASLFFSEKLLDEFKRRFL